MLNLHLVAIGGRMPNWVTEGCDEYRRRIRGRMTLNLVEVPAVKRGKNVNPARIAMVEERRLTAAVPGGCRLIALDRQGRQMSTMDIVRRLEDWLGNGEQAALVVGGPEGLSGDFLAKADECWSLSALTLAHPVVRVVLAEQVYRCWSILEGLPYHR